MAKGDVASPSCRAEIEMETVANRMKSIEIPSSVIVIGQSSFCQCASLESVIFVNDCRLGRIEASAFAGSGLKTKSFGFRQSGL
jgi:hypothetical protein